MEHVNKGTLVHVATGLTVWAPRGNHVLSEAKRGPALCGQGGLAYMGCLPLWGERGGHPRNFHTSSKNARGFLQSHNFLISPERTITPKKIAAG